MNKQDQIHKAIKTTRSIRRIILIILVDLQMHRASTPGLVIQHNVPTYLIANLFHEPLFYANVRFIITINYI